MEPLSARAMQEMVDSFGGYLREELMRAPSTVVRYVEVMRRFAEFLVREHGEAPIALESLRKDDLLRFLRSDCSAGSEPLRSKWNHHLSVLRVFYGWLWKQEKLVVNTAKLVDRVRTSKAERLPLSFDEMLDLVDSARRHSPPALRTRNVAILQVFLHCSLRVGEVSSLRLEQVDLARRTFLSVRTKGDQRLSVMFNDVVAEALEAYLGDRDGLTGGQAVPELFVSRLGRGIAKRSLDDLVSRYGRLASIRRPIFPHLLRHSSATEYSELGTDMAVLQGHLGHRSIKTTQVYNHVRESRRREAVDK